MLLKFEFMLLTVPVLLPDLEEEQAYQYRVNKVFVLETDKLSRLVSFTSLKLYIILVYYPFITMCLALDCSIKKVGRCHYTISITLVW